MRELGSLESSLQASVAGLDPTLSLTEMGLHIPSTKSSNSVLHDLRVAHNLVWNFFLPVDARKLGEAEFILQKRNTLNLYIQICLLLWSFFLVWVASIVASPVCLILRLIATGPLSKPFFEVIQLGGIRSH